MPFNFQNEPQQKATFIIGTWMVKETRLERLGRNSLFQYFIEPRLWWYPLNYGHIEAIYVDSTRLWIPPVLALNSFDSEDLYMNNPRDTTVTSFY